MKTKLTSQHNEEHVPLIVLGERDGLIFFTFRCLHTDKVSE